MASNGPRMAQGLRALAQRAPAVAGNPALSGEEQHGSIMEPATLAPTKRLAAGLRSFVEAMGGPISGRMAEHGAQQQARFQTGDASPTRMTGETMDLADSVAGGLVGNMGLAGALRAYHGSPHRFDKFSMDKIGTGEGAQAYGHGLYMAESPDVARQYRDNVSALSQHRRILKDNADFVPSTPVETLARNAARDSRGHADRLAEWFSDARASLERAPQYAPYSLDDLNKAERIAKELDVDIKGALYTTKLDVEPEDLLDWDAPLSEQSEKVRAAFQDAASKIEPSSPLAKAVNAQLRNGDWGNLTGEAAYTGIGGLGADKAGASHLLREAGIPGIRYLDQGSRAAGDGTRNFVIFDDSLVDITHVDGKPLTKAERKAAVAAMLAGGTAAMGVAATAEAKDGR